LGAAQASEAPGGLRSNIPNFVVTTYTSEEGLPSNLVSDAVFDLQGFLWVATEGGVIRHDGVEAWPVVDAQGAALTKSRRLLVRRNGDVLWAGEAGVARLSFDGVQARASRLPELEAFKRVELLFEDTRGRLWLADVSSVSIWEDGRLTRQQIPDKALPMITAWTWGRFRADAAEASRAFVATELNDGTVLIGTGAGAVLRKDPGSDELVLLNAEGTALAGEVSAMHTAPDGSLWVADRSGIHRVRPSLEAYQVDLSWPLPQAAAVLHQPWGYVMGSAQGLSGMSLNDSNLRTLGSADIRGVRSVRAGPRGSLAVATDTGLAVLHPKPFEEMMVFRQKGIQALSPFAGGMAILAADEGASESAVHWIQTLDEGSWSLRQLSPPMAQAHSLVEHQGLLWVLTGEGKIFAYSSTGVKKHELSLPLEGPVSMGASCGNRLWFGLDDIESPQLYSLQGEANEANWERQLRVWRAADGLVAAPRFVRCIEGQIYAGVNSAASPLMRLQGDRFVSALPAHVSSQLGAELNDVAAMADGALLLASSKGLWSFGKDGLQRLDAVGPPGTEVIRAVVVSNYGWGVWAGTNRGAFNLSDEGQLWFQRSEGIGNPTVAPRSMALDEWGQLWVSHYRGLVRLSAHYRLQSMPQPSLAPFPIAESARWP
jgi:ligand-binding sensor domain-containing protein